MANYTEEQWNARKNELMEKCYNEGLYIVKNGIIKLVEVPKSGYGKSIIHWENGKPTRMETTSTELIK